MQGPQLNIIVVGAGIAGLGAAIVLSRAGHNVTVMHCPLNSSGIFNILLTDCSDSREVTIQERSWVYDHLALECYFCLESFGWSFLQHFLFLPLQIWSED